MASLPTKPTHTPDREPGTLGPGAESWACMEILLLLQALGSHGMMYLRERVRGRFVLSCHGDG